MAAISFTLNAHPVEVMTDGDTRLLDALRNHLGLAGTRFGCGLEQCGACMVLLLKDNPRLDQWVRALVRDAIVVVYCT